MARHVMLVCGPPCSGKTAWVKAHAGPQDIVVDWDEIAVALGSPVTHDHSEAYAVQATQVRANIERTVSQMKDGTAYVIRTLASPKQRKKVAKRLNATEVRIMAPPLSVVTARAISAARSLGTHRAIAEWFKKNPPPPTGGSRR